MSVHFMRFVTLFAFGAWSVSAAGSAAEVDAAEVDFERDIFPILEEHCLHCHGEDEQESGLRLDLRPMMLKGGDSGLAAVVPNHPEKSYLIEVINHVDEEMAMPPDEDQIPTEEIALLEQWVKEGAIWPGQMDASIEEKSDHWSFQPIVRPSVPAIAPSSDNPVDAFLTRSLETHDLTFSDPADPRSLIRRVSLVLTGLPPTTAEIAKFLDAYSIDPNSAYAQCVDRLLESPHFGERWAQHWLDVIRWAETNGSESNMYRKNAWIYRDYVIRAFNEDKPYDQFLFEQIAGDTVGQGDATGYLVSGPHVPVATVGQEPVARRQARADRMDEILQTVGASAMGVTIGCARCHNHKFDPISIRDYYSMSAVFQDVEFGGRFPELAEDHPRRIRGRQLYGQIDKLHRQLIKIGPWEEDWVGYKELHFAPTTTQKVRITFNWGGVRLDEIEIFGDQNRHQNLALASVGTKAFSPPRMAVARASISNVNDGQFGTQAWGSKAPKESKEKPWIEFTFQQPHEINRIRLSTNREDFLETDYLEGLNKFNFGGYRVEVQSIDLKSIDSKGTDLQGDDPQGVEVPWKQVASTMDFAGLNKQHPSRVTVMQDLQELIATTNEQGPTPSFVARFTKPVKTHILGRGSPENPRDEVFPAGLKELGGDLEIAPYASGRKRRVAFAKWLTESSNPLTARVAVNRIWHHVFGQGIVTTTSDFGAAGAPATHPELLDWLAAELVAPSSKEVTNPRRGQHSSEDQSITARNQDPPQPWSMKHIIRLLVMSDAFRQASQPQKAGLAVDAGSSLLWRFPPKRVEAEVIRDSILQASQSLDDTIGGRSYRIHNVKKRYSQWQVTDNHGPKTWRRMIYQERMRRVDDQIFTAFDFPDCGQVRAKRPVSTTPLQALNLMNSDFVIEQSKLIADRVRRETEEDDSASVDRCFALLLGRHPTPTERDACLAIAKSGDLATVCRAIINTNEFSFLP